MSNDSHEATPLVDTMSDICTCFHTREDHEHDESAYKGCACCNLCKRFVFMCSEGSPKALAIAANPSQAKLPALPEEKTDGFDEWNSREPICSADPTQVSIISMERRHAWNAALSRRAQPQDASETVTWRVDAEDGYSRIYKSEQDALTRYSEQPKSMWAHLWRIDSREVLVAQRKAGA